MKKNKNKEMEEDFKNELSPEEEGRDTATESQAEEENIGAGDEENKELEELRNKYLRLVAEFDNYRKRVARERIELMQTSEKEVILSLLDVLDDADRAEGEMARAEDVNSVREGASLIFNKLRKALRSRGLKPMECLHEDYDAELQEAIAEIPAPSEALKGKVIDDVQKGYYLNDKIIRHAKVVVGK